MFLTDADGHIVQQEKISLNNPSKSSLPLISAGSRNSPNVEKTIAVRSRYSKNGQLRTGEYANHLRSTNVVTAIQPKLFVVGDDMDGPLVVSSYTGEQVMCRFEAIYRADDQITLAVGP